MAAIGIVATGDSFITRRTVATEKLRRLAMSAVTLAESFYVLARVYKHTKADAAAKLLPLVQSDVLDVENRSRVLDSLRRIVTANVDFGDAYLAATAAERSDQIASFDGDFQAFTDVTTLVPP